VASSKSGSIQLTDLDARTFGIVSLNGKPVYEGVAYKFNFKEGSVYVKICNSMFGGFTLTDNIIKSQMTSTLMSCERTSDIMGIENTVKDLFAKGATISLSQSTLTLSRGATILILEEVGE
jgi:heat shock protein HslJ